MMPHSCVALFCEDIREEVGGAHTLVGVMPDNINIAGPPLTGGTAFMFPKMGIYVRVNIDASKPPEGTVTARAVIPGLADIPLGEIGHEAIETAISESVSKGHPVAGLIFKAVFSPLQLRESGVAIVYAKIDGKDAVAGILNIQMMSPVG